MTDFNIIPDSQPQNSGKTDSKFERSKFYIDLAKWFIGSIAIVIITMIIDKGFKERSAGIQEMQAYDKYVDIILEADNIEARWKLAEYFSTVTPTERLRDRWISYKSLIEEDYKTYLDLKKREAELLQKNDDSLSQQDKNLIIIQKALAPMETKLIKTNNFDLANSYEQKAYTSLLNKDVDGAIAGFRNSENAYNGYHQAYEIANYLEENKEKLQNSNSEYWNVAMNKVGKDFSWKMPVEIKKRLIKVSK